MSHKFGKKINNIRPSIYWIIDADLKYKPTGNSSKLEIYAQENLIIKPKTSMRISLHVGIKHLRGSVTASLRQNLKEQGCILQNSITSEPVENIIISVYNTSANDVEIKSGESICLLTN